MHVHARVQEHMTVIRLLLSCLGVFAAVHACDAQFPELTPQGAVRDTIPTIDPDSLAPPAQATFVTPWDFYKEKLLIFDSLDSRTHMYDPLSDREFELANLGNLGSAHRYQYFSIEESKGLDLGFHQYDAYKHAFRDFRFYDAPTAITEFRYSQGVDQRNGIFNAMFGRTFSDGIKLSVDYQRINQIGLFDHQQGKHTALGIGIWIDTRDGRYDGLFYYGSNSIVQQDNGGLADINELDENTTTLTKSVLLRTALTTHRERTLSIQNHLHLIRENSSVDRRIFVDVIHTGHYQTGFVKFYDDSRPDAAGTAMYYDTFLVDNRGMRYFTDFRSFDNQLDLQFRVQPDSTRPDAFLRAGLQHRHTDLTEEPIERQIDEIFLNARGMIRISDQLELESKAYLQLTGQTGDFLLAGSLTYEVGTFGAFRAALDIHNRSPNLLERRLFISKIQVWENDFSDIRHSRIGLEALFTKWRFRAHGEFHLITNDIYYDQDRFPRQLSGTLTVKQLTLSKDLRIWTFGVDASITLQEVPTPLPYPALILRGQLYYADRWFNDNLQVRAGFDLSMTDAYRGVNYFPVTGRFHLDDSGSIPQYPAVDAFVDLQVENVFSAFFKLENISAWFDETHYVQTLGYPQFESYFRFGLRMTLFY